MKQLLHLKSLLIAMLVLFGGGSVSAQETKTLKFEVNTASRVTLVSGTLPEDVTATYKSTYSTTYQLTKGNSMTLTLKDFPFKVSSVTLDLKTNKSSGQGNLTVKHNNNTIHSTTSLTPDLVSYSTSYSEYTFDANDTQTSGDLVITLAATANSIYCDAFTITYVDNTSATGTTDPENSFANADEYATVGEDYSIQELTTQNTSGVRRYGSSDETVATVDGNGNVTLKKSGETTITVTTLANDTYREGSASYILHVAKGTPVLSFASETVTAYLGTNQDGPELNNPGDGTKTYTISDPDVATIRQTTGYIEPLKAGQATVTVTTSETDAWFSATTSYTLVVKEPFHIDAEGDYEWVKDASTLAVGDELVIVYQSSNTIATVMGNQDTNNFKYVAVNYADGITDKSVITIPQAKAAQATPILLEGSEGAWHFHTNNGYLCAAGSGNSNYLRTTQTMNDNAKAVITISDKGNAAIVFQGSYTNRYLKYNSQSSLFSCYSSSSSQTPVQLYRKIDTETPPTVTFSPESGTEVNYGTQVTISARTATSITYSVNGGEPVTVNGTSATVTINTHSTIKAKAANNYGTSEEVTAEYTIHAESPAFTYDPDEYTITFGDEFKAPELGKAADYDGTVTFASDNAEVAEVDAETGDVTVKGAGTAVITATGTATEHFEAATASYTLTVNKQASAVSFAESLVEITYGDNYDKQKATAEGFSGNLVYTSSNERVVKFHGNGVIDVLGPGTVTITATAPATETTEESSATYTLKIYEPADAVEGATEALNEDFHVCDGTNTDWGGSSGFVTVPTELGWETSYCQAGPGYLKFGTSKNVGVATSPTFSVVGEAPLSFALAPWIANGDSEEAKVTVSLINAKFENGENNVELNTKELTQGEFTTFDQYKIVGNSDAVKITFSANGASYNRFFLDNVVVGGGAQPAHEINLTFSSAGYLTWVATADIDFSQTEGVTAYQITEATPQGITAEEVQKAPKGAALLLKGTGTVELKRTSGVSSLNGNKMLACTDASVTGITGSATSTDIYVLGNGGNGLGFYMLKNTLQAGKGYLKISGDAGAKATFIGFEETEAAETTGISDYTVPSTEDDNFYNLQGVRVVRPQKGIYIKDGKKMIIK